MTQICIPNRLTKVGAAVIVRPDQYVSWIGAVDDYKNMEAFFAGFMRKQEDGGFKGSVEAPSDWVACGVQPNGAS